MLLDIKSYIRKPEVAELISYAVFPDDQSVEKAILQYENQEWMQLFGFEDQELLIGLIGFERVEDSLTIHHLAVIPENRGIGYGRGMILELMTAQKPSRVIAETDEESVQFYRNIGFEVHTLGELFPGVERFRCVYEIEDESEQER